METRARSIVKALTWRVTALVITTSVVWIASGSIELAASVGLVDTVIKLGVYYGHERCWLKVRFGKIRPPEYQI
jgi:uncharacterized membrane protein